MATVSNPTATLRSALGLLEAICHAGILPTRTIEDLHARVQSGCYPNDAQDLAARLIRKDVLTGYQARHLLHGQGGGLVAGRYVILDRLGTGAMGKVYKARHRLMGRIVALKFIARVYLARPNAIPRFLREMRLVGRLDHPNIVRALDAEEIGRNPCIVMEYVPGQDLERLLLGHGPLPPAEVIGFATQVALGLAHAHERGVIHRDIKPSNLLLGEDGRVRILDLGLGALMDDDDADRGSFATCDGMAAGTADYMSPEQAVGRPELDGRSDLYSLGCVMYHLLTGQVPFPGDSRVESMASRIKGRAAPLAELRPGLPPRLVDVVEQLMANRRDDRHATAAEAAEALRGLGECERSVACAGRPFSVVGTSTERRWTVGGDDLPQGESLSTRSTSISPVVTDGWWLRLATSLSSWPPGLIFLAGATILLATVGAGFLLSIALH
jgi:serine/threonine protein kinase